jgi:hypothetical protein
MKSKIILAVILAFLVSGCISHKIKSPEFPPSCNALCQQQLDKSKKAIEALDGKSLKYKSSLRVALHKGEKKIDGMWAWQIAPNYYVGGLTEWSNFVTVGCHPVTMGEVNAGVLFHEFGHFWLTTNYGIRSHDPKYDPVFHWSGLREKSFEGIRKTFSIDPLDEDQADE